MYSAGRVRIVPDDVARIVYRVGRRAKVPLRARDIFVFSTLVQKSYQYAGGVRVCSDNALCRYIGYC